MNIVMLVIPLEEYNRLLAKFDESRREYAFLKNGFVVRSAAGCEEIQIPCDKAGAELIMVLVGCACPDILPAISLPVTNFNCDVVSFDLAKISQSVPNGVGTGGLAGLPTRTIHIY